MNWPNIWKLAKSDYIKLVPILALAFYMAYIPHLHYPYPVHIDEWVHMAFSKAILTEGNISFPYPFSGEVIQLFDQMEIGFQLFWGIFQRISGISWPDIFRFFPSIIFMITVFSVYTMARKEGFGWEAALLTCLIPTNVGIMGPAFLIPVSMALIFVPLSLYIAFNFRTIGAYLALFVMVCLLISIHAPSAICLLLILAPYVLLSFKGEFKHSLGLMLALLGPFVVTLPWTYEMVLSYGQSLFTAQPPSTGRDLPILMRDYGYVPLISCLVGTFILAMKGGRKYYALAGGLLVIMAMLAIFYTVHFGLLIVYLRGLLFGMLMAGIVAGASWMWLRKISLPESIGMRLKIPSIVARNIGLVLCLVLIGFTLATTIPARHDTPYYHMIDEADYKAFVWIRDNVGENYDTAILDPWKATAFTAVTGKRVYTRIHFSPQARDKEAYAFLNEGCLDTTFLSENGISLVYTRGSCSNPDLVEVRENVYLLKVK